MSERVPRKPSQNECDSDDGKEPSDAGGAARLDVRRTAISASMRPLSANPDVRLGEQVARIILASPAAVGAPMLLLAVFCNAREGHCKACKWRWRC